jgi:hypothetical protein
MAEVGGTTPPSSVAARTPGRSPVRIQGDIILSQPAAVWVGGGGHCDTPHRGGRGDACRVQVGDMHGLGGGKRAINAPVRGTAWVCARGAIATFFLGHTRPRSAAVADLYHKYML